MENHVVETDRRSFLSVLGVGAFALSVGSPLFAACGNQHGDSEKAIRMGIVPGTQALWRYAESEVMKGLGGQYEVEFINFTDESTHRNAFLSGDLDVYTALVPTLPALSEQVGACQMFVPYAWLRQGISVFTKKSSQAVSLEDLKGERLSVFPATHPGYAYWRAAHVARTGRRIEDDFEIVETPQPDVAVDTGDAVAGLVAGWAWVQREGTGEYKLLATLADEWGQILGHDRILVMGGGVARREWVDEHQDFIRDYRSALGVALERVASDRSGFVKIAMKGGGEGSPPLDEKQTDFLTEYDGLTTAGADRVEFSRDDVDDNTVVFENLAKAGYLEKAPDASEVAAMFGVGD